MARTSKKPKPTFEVARDPVSDAKSGWVYRSDAAAAPEPRAIEFAEPPAAERRELFEPRPDQAGRSSPQPGSSWVKTGMYLMVLPVTIGMSIMFAPVTWLLSGRSRR